MGDKEGEGIDWAVKNGDLEQVKASLAKDTGALLRPLPNGRHLLHLAADYGQKDVIEFLVKNGASVNVEDKYGITPLLAAIFENHAACVKLLIEKGANKTGKSPDGRSYLDCAETKEVKDMLK